jgi:hypothetical protein
MSAARSSKQCRRRGEWRFIFNDRNQIVGLIEQRTDGQWRAVSATDQELGLCNTAEAAADLVREEAPR